jgi:hypothetical protein
MNNDNYKYNGIDLRTATVFDLTNDADFLSRYLSPELGIKSKEDYLQMVGPKSKNHVFNMLEYAEENNIPKLVKQLKEIFADDLVAFFNE